MDLRDQLQTTLGDAYTLERELGGGGMSRVFLASEAALGRRVVVKVLSPDLAAGVSAERFVREIRLAASLQQANIVPVLASGEMHGVPYYTMPFVDGLSLRERLSRGTPLSVDEAVSVLRDVTRALAYAHDRGIVHRDIKPENVLLSGDAAVVTDFGVAKAVSAARTLPPGLTLTQAGMAVGTPAYMAPEQAAGDPSTDHRADIYALGCLGYELLSGASPFAGRSLHEIYAAHLGEVPVPIASRRADVPSSLASLITRCLEKDPARRPGSAREVLQALNAVTTPGALSPWRAPRTTRWRVVVAGVGLLVALAAIYVWKGRPTGGDIAPRSLAVLPFATVGGDSTQEYLADGISDELTTALGKVSGVRVVSRTLTYRYRGRRDVDSREVGRTLEAGYVVQGSVRRLPTGMRVSAQLTSAADNGEVWANSYDVDAKQIFRAQDSLARAITVALQRALGTRVAAVMPAGIQGTSNADAYDLFLQGRYLLQRRGPGVLQSVEKFEHAIALDSTFARPYAGLAEALELEPYFFDVPESSIHARAVAAARRALARDSSLAEAHVALGLTAMHARQWDSALVSMERAVSLEPDDASAHHQYGRVLAYHGRLSDAARQFQRAKALDPVSALYSAWLGGTFALLGRAAEAEAEIQRGLVLDSTNGVVLNLGSLARLRSGRRAEAISMARRMPDGGGFRALKLYTLAAAGERAEVARTIAALENEHPRGWNVEAAIGLGYLGLGDAPRALAALERSEDTHEFWPNFQPLCDPMFDLLRSNPRFAALVRRAGLDPALATNPRTACR
jgi:serine/threonine-protein kinase